MKNLFIILFLFPFLINAQQYRNPVADNGLIHEKSYQASGPKGSLYQDENWRLSQIIIRRSKNTFDTIFDVSSRLDLRNNLIELMIDGQIKVAEGKNVERMILYNTTTGLQESYINADKLKLNDIPLLGFCKVLFEGDKMSLMERYYLEVAKGYYNAQLDVGSREDQIIKKKKTYLLKDGSLIEFDKKKFFSLLDDDKQKVEAYVKDNKINIKDQDQLIVILNYFNSI